MNLQTFKALSAGKMLGAVMLMVNPEYEEGTFTESDIDESRCNGACHVDFEEDGKHLVQILVEEQEGGYEGGGEYVRVLFKVLLDGQSLAYIELEGAYESDYGIEYDDISRATFQRPVEEVTVVWHKSRKPVGATQLLNETPEQFTSRTGYDIMNLS